MNLSRDRVYMLAADHRWQLDEWCDKHDVGRDRIPALKGLILDGFLRAREEDPRVSSFGSMLLDEQYAAAHIRRARSSDVIVGTPAEWPGSFPLRWATDPFEAALTGDFVKVLVRHRPDYPDGVIGSQIEHLLRLQALCREQSRDLLVEVLVPRQDEAEDAFETTGRAQIVANYIRRAYDAGLVPDFWKMEGTTSRDAAAQVDAAVRQNASPRFLVLGKGAGLTLIAQWFAAARTMESAAGFAIGRTAYWEAATKWARGGLPSEAAVSQVAAVYREIVDLWDRQGC
jgi:5-dehydro-2-deoxygluconokinase